MLTLATNAISVIRQATSRGSNPDEAGLRISPAEARDQLAVELASAPSPGDQVLVAGGARVFIAAEAAASVDNLELYAVVQEGNVSLALREPIAGS